MANVVKKHSISSELAQKMVNAAVAKARELGVTENVAILDDGGNLKAFSRMDGASIPTIEIAQKKAYTALFGVSTQDLFDFIKGDPSLLAGIPTLARVAAWGGGFPIKVNGEVVGAIGLSGAPRCRTTSTARERLWLSYPMQCRLSNKRRDHNDKHPPNRADTVRRGQRHPLRLSPIRQGRRHAARFHAAFSGWNGSLGSRGHGRLCGTSARHPVRQCGGRRVDRRDEIGRA